MEGFPFFKKAKNVEVVTVEGFSSDPTLSAVLSVAWPGSPEANRGSHIQGFGEIGRTSNEHSTFPL